MGMPELLLLLLLLLLPKCLISPGKFAAGLFDDQTYVEDVDAWKTVLDCPAHQQVAYDAALQSLTLLQDSGLHSLARMFRDGTLKNLVRLVGMRAR